MKNATVNAVLGYVPPSVYINMAAEHLTKALRSDNSPWGRAEADHLRTVAGRYFAAAVEVHNLSK